MNRSWLIRVTLALLATASTLSAAQTVTILSPQEPRTLLPHFDLLTLAQEAQRLVYECLFVIDETGNIAPQLAAEVPTLENGGISADGTTYTIRLRPGVTWQDGAPLTSADVAFTWRVITDPNLPIPSRTVWEEIEAVETPDALTAVVRFPRTNVSFLGIASTGNCFILPKHLLEGTDLVNSPLNRQPVGTGPFRVVQWESGSFIRFERNPRYREAGKPLLDEVIYRIVPGSEGQRAALQRGEADVLLHITLADLRFLEALPDYQAVTVPTFTWWQFWLNNEDPILSDRAVRQALAQGLEKALITETLMGGIVTPLEAMLPPTHWAHNPDVTVYPLDPETAARLLDEAGWALGADGIRRKDGQPLRIEILNIAGQAERRQVVQAAQANWRAIGIDAVIREIDAASFPPTMAQGDFQIAYGFFGEQQEPAWSLWLGTNWQRYRNPEALALLQQTAGVVDREARKALIQRFQAIVAEDIAMLPLAPRPLLNAVHTRLEGHAPTLTGSLWNVMEWTRR